MNFNPATVLSMGFENYCTNYAVNIFENGQLFDGFKFEDETHSVIVTKTEKHHSVLIRAYVEGLGWKNAEIII